jgi:endonuclease/exonuclease/phosphatase (EEP) superfamily protein YafD
MPGSPTLAHLAALGWTDGLAGSPAAAAPTYELGGLGLKLDHVLVPPGVTCTDAAVLDGGGSDHDAILATLSWAAR